MESVYHIGTDDLGSHTVLDEILLTALETLVLDNETRGKAGADVNWAAIHAARAAIAKARGTA